MCETGILLGAQVEVDLKALDIGLEALLMIELSKPNQGSGFRPVHDPVGRNAHLTAAASQPVDGARQPSQKDATGCESIEAAASAEMDCNAAARSALRGNQRRVHCDRRVKDLGNRAILLGPTDHPSERGLVQVWDQGTQCQR